VQPCSTTELLFLSSFSASGSSTTWVPGMARGPHIVVGLGGFFLPLRPHGGQELPSTTQWIVRQQLSGSDRSGRSRRHVGTAMVAGRLPRAAAAVALLYLGTDQGDHPANLDHGWSAVFTHFEPYMLSVAGSARSSCSRAHCTPARSRHPARPWCRRIVGDAYVGGSPVRRQSCGAAPVESRSRCWPWRCSSPECHPQPGRHDRRISPDGAPMTRSSAAPGSGR